MQPRGFFSRWVNLWCISSQQGWARHQPVPLQTLTSSTGVRCKAEERCPTARTAGLPGQPGREPGREAPFAPAVRYPSEPSHPKVLLTPRQLTKCVTASFGLPGRACTCKSKGANCSWKPEPCSQSPLCPDLYSLSPSRSTLCLPRVTFPGSSYCADSLLLMPDCTVSPFRGPLIKKPEILYFLFPPLCLLCY